MHQALLLFLSIFVFSFSLAGQDKAILCGRLIDGQRETAVDNAVILIEGSQISGVLETAALPDNIEVAVAEAGRRGVPVMAHAHSTEGIKQAVKAGVRSFEHGSFIDEEGMDLMIERGTFLIPTAYIGDYFLEAYEESEALEKAVALHKKFDPVIKANYELAIRKGVKVGVGSDYVGMPVSYCAREFAKLVEYGMTPMQAIQAGTRVNAELLQMEERIGTIEAGKLADIIATKGNPLEGISALERIIFVMKGGKVVKKTE